MATQITVAAPRPAPSFTPLFVAIDRFLPDEGIEAKIEYSVKREKLISGEIDYMATAVGRGAFLEPWGAKLVCQHAIRATGHTLVVRPELATAEQLGLVVMTGADDGGLVRELRSILAQNNVELDRSDIGLTYVEGGHPDQYRALREGIGDGAPMGAPWWVFLVKEGWVSLGCEDDYTPSVGCNGVHATPEKIARDPEQVRAVVRAYVKAVRYCHENVEGTLETMLKYASDWGVDNMDIAREVYKVLSPYWGAEIDVGVIERLLQHTAEKTGKPVQPVESVLDLQFLQEVLRKDAVPGGKP